MEVSNIKTRHIYSGFYILHYNGYYVVILKIGNNKWQACLPSGWFANSICQENLDKLASRKDRGKIDGNGDFR